MKTKNRLNEIYKFQINYATFISQIIMFVCLLRTVIKVYFFEGL